jgi:hypothetical protein
MDGRVGVEGDDAFLIMPGSSWNEGAFRAWADTQAVIDYAGHAAIVAVLGIGDMGYRSGRKEGAQDDFDKASNRLVRNRRRIKAAKDRAVEIVSRRNDDIRKIAGALIERQKLFAPQPQVDWLLSSDLPMPDWLA